MRARDDLVPAAPQLEALLTPLAIQGHVAASIQPQAMYALVFLYKRVRQQAWEDRSNAMRADQTVTIPVVMTHAEVATVLSLMRGTPQRVAKGLDGSGWRIMDAVRLRVKDLDVVVLYLEPAAKPTVCLEVMSLLTSSCG